MNNNIFETLQITLISEDSKKFMPKNNKTNNATITNR